MANPCVGTQTVLARNVVKDAGAPVHGEVRELHCDERVLAPAGKITLQRPANVMTGWTWLRAAVNAYHEVAHEGDGQQAQRQFVLQVQKELRDAIHPKLHGISSMSASISVAYNDETMLIPANANARGSHTAVGTSPQERDLELCLVLIVAGGRTMRRQRDSWKYSRARGPKYRWVSSLKCPATQRSTRSTGSSANKSIQNILLRSRSCRQACRLLGCAPGCSTTMQPTLPLHLTLQPVDWSKQASNSDAVINSEQKTSRFTCWVMLPVAQPL